MSVNRYNPYYNTAAPRSQSAQYPTQQAITPSTASQRNYEPAVWQWVPDSPEDLRGSFRVLMSGLPTENVAKKEIVVSTPVACQQATITRVIEVDPYPLRRSCFRAMSLRTSRWIRYTMTVDSTEAAYSR